MMCSTLTFSSRACLVALSLTLIPAAILSTAPARADELMKWDRVPLQIPLKTGTERVIFADKNVRVGFPPALNGKRTVARRRGARRPAPCPDRRRTTGGGRRRSQLQPHPGVGDQPAVSAPAQPRHGDVRFPTLGAGQHARSGLQHRFPFL